MDISIISFTKTGYELSLVLSEAAADEMNLRKINSGKINVYTKCRKLSGESEKAYVAESVEEWAHSKMMDKDCLVFVGACGIAVRAIASSVENKLTDSPVIVIDELGNYVIPILSGHVGRANALARLIAESIGATSVITTATDINDEFSVDVFATENDLAILNKAGIAKVSAKALAGEKITVSLDETNVLPKVRSKLGGNAKITITKYPPKEAVDIVISADKNMLSYDAALYLKPKRYIIGIGCKRNTPFEKIDNAITKSLNEANLQLLDIKLIASIDVKANEPGILRWSGANRIRFVTFTAEELMTVKGDFSASEFVKAKVGVDNVCERAAVLAGCKTCEKGGELVYKKHAYDGVTVAIAKCIV